MADNFDITMKQYNGADYDTLYPKNISQQVLLNDSVFASLINLATVNPNILEALKKIYSNLTTSITTINDTLTTSITNTNTRISNLVSYGTYVGDGQTTKSLTFSYIPKIILIMEGYTSGSSPRAIAVIMRSSDSSVSIPSYGVVPFFDDFISVSWSSTSTTHTVNLTLDQDAQTHLNLSGVTYSYIAIQ